MESQEIKKNEFNENNDSLFRKILFLSVTVTHIIGVAVGAISGFLYYTYVGCASGTCAITSNPWLTVLWGAALGFLIIDMFVKPKK